ncbi:MAG: isoprenylcysteine carboxylmethyltransferase family protein [Myxococcales bacterium]|nr:isoprenylcysteine carboxylmethyltransferase family protein [Myxococcales bacterium]
MGGTVLLLKNLLFTFLVPGTVAVYVPLWIVGDRAAAGGVLQILALAVLALGFAIYAWCVWDFARFGRGTPAPIDAPKRLVVRGLYRRSRNPMYVGVLSVILGWSLWFGAPVLAGYAAGVFSLFQAFVVLYEEPHLEGEFGDSYREYCAAVRRWF